jgi:hypothetical protein
MCAFHREHREVRSAAGGDGEGELGLDPSPRSG